MTVLLESFGVQSLRLCVFGAGHVGRRVAQLMREAGAMDAVPQKTRCGACNGELESAAPESVKGDVPPGVAERNTEFWRCKSCRKVFWEGSHWRNIMRVYEAAKTLL